MSIAVWGVGKLGESIFDLKKQIKRRSGSFPLFIVW